MTVADERAIEAGRSAVRIALLQMTSGIDVDANCAAIIAGLDQAQAAGAVMLFTPEMALLLDRDRARAARSIDGVAIDTAVASLREAAAARSMWLHIGSLPCADAASAPRWKNRSLLIGPDGAITAHYDKLHLFDVELDSGETWRESATYAAGDAVVTAATPLGVMGLSICYDLRFAALYDRFGAAGCTTIAIPAAFTVPTGEAHWHVLMRARAIEQGAYVIAAAQCGAHADGRTTYGHSLVVSPWGEVLLDMGQADDPGAATVATITIDPGAVARVRRQLPTIRHRRPLPD